MISPVHNSLGFAFKRARIAFFPALFFLLLLSAAGPLHAQVKLWGMISYGGENTIGTIINLNPDGSDFNAVPFTKIDGRYPQNDLLKASNGKFYGMTTQGGNSGSGLIFEYDPVTFTYLVLHHFSSGTGGYPQGGLIESGGKFYGMTNGGGDFNAGVLFEFDPIGNVYTVLKHLDNTNDGGYPYGNLLESGGKLYGMTTSGGNYNTGVLFEFDPVGNVYTVLKHLEYTNDGAYPYGNLLESGGKFYGLTPSGGIYGYGTLFEFDPVGNVYTVLKHLDHTNDGAYPYGSLIESGGKLYGMTNYGGYYYYGTLFEFDLGSNAFTVLKHLDYTNDGAYPFRNNLLESGGKLYGMTPSGGSNGSGVLFELNPVGNVYTVLKHLDYSTDGAYPYGSLLESGGKLYGMTSQGGSSGYGTIFEFNPVDNAYTVLEHFDSSPNGANPNGSLLESGGKFYGMATSGGSNGYGTLFEYNPSGNVFTVLKDLDYYTAGAYPNGSLLESGGKFYGMANSGGSNGYGTLFEYNPSGNVFTVLKNFDYYTDGGGPAGSLLESGGKFYGMTTSGGNYNTGVLFEFDPVGNVYTVLKHLEYTNDGGYPYGNLLESGGKFYGMTSSGGSNSRGTLFEFDPVSNGFTVLKHLDFSTDGAYPYGSLLESGGKLYGLTNNGGYNFSGTLFEFDLGSNTYTVLKHLDYTNDGGYPYGSLLESGGKFYGMTYQGGSNGYGTVFEWNPSDNMYTVLRHLDYSNDGGYPTYGNLIAVGASTQVDISGTIFWKGDGVAGVNNAIVALSGDASGSDATDTNGDFDLTGSTGANFVITPTKNTGGLLNGVTAADATAIQKHLTGSSIITDFYRLIAADCNRSNNISSIDAALVRQALLGSPSALNILNTAGHWRFVRSDYAPVLAGPYTLDHYSLYNNRELTGVSGVQSGQDFYGIKAGDVFEESNPGVDIADPSLKPDPAAQPLVWHVRDQVLKAGQIIELDFSVDGFTDIAAFQHGMRFDPAVLQYQQATGTNAELALDAASHFGAYRIAQGELRTVWSVSQGKTLPGLQPAYRLRFKVLQGGKKLSEVLDLDPAVLAALAYTTDLAQREVQLVFTDYGQPGLNLPDITVGDYFDLLKNRPNPFSDQTTIGFLLPEAADAQLRVLDLSGRELWRVDKSYPAGYHEEVFHLNEIGATGMLFYELTTPQGTQTRKMLAVKK